MQQMTDHYTNYNAQTAKTTIHTGINIDHIHTGTRGGSIFIFTKYALYKCKYRGLSYGLRSAARVSARSGQLPSCPPYSYDYVDIGSNPKRCVHCAGCVEIAITRERTESFR